MIGESGKLYEIRDSKVLKPLLNDIVEVSSSSNVCLALSNRGTLYQISQINNSCSKIRLSCIN